jgi:hypothetical protein
MAAVATEGKTVGKKKSTAKGEVRRYGTLIRVSDEFAEALKKAAQFELASMAEFANAVLLPIVEKRYRDAVLREAKRMEGDEKKAGAK